MVRALLLLTGGVTEERYWSETWTTADRFLAQLTAWLRQSRAIRAIELDEGWSADRDVSVPVGRWAWIDVRALAEDHGSGRTLLRVSTHLRPTTLGVVGALGLAAALIAGASAGIGLRWPAAGVSAAMLALLLTAFGIWRLSQATAILRRGVGSVAGRMSMVAMKAGPARAALVAPSVLRMYGLRSAAVLVVMIVALGAGTFLLREAATAEVVIGARRGISAGVAPGISAWIDTPSGITVDRDGAIYYADSHYDLIWRRDPSGPPVVVAGNQALGSGFSGDNGPATRAQLYTPDGVCIAPDGDLIVADSHNDRIRRIDKPTRVITTIAGSGANGYDGDDKPATMAALNTPNAVACARNGDIYIADTLNYRVRMIDHATGLIRNVAGDGSAGDVEDISDGGPAVQAHLNMPSDVAVAPNGDVYIADMHHNRVRRVDAITHFIGSVAGNGTFGSAGNGGPATAASLSGPAGIALASEPGGRITIYIADYYNGLVRIVGPDGIIRNLSDEGRLAFGAPTRVAFHADPKATWLYVADASKDQVVSVNIPTASRNPFAIGSRPLAVPATRRSAG
jgi:sugar lactone lactonase YvrE